MHGCVRVHQGTEETISFVSEEKKVVEEIIMPTPVHSSRLVKTQPRRSYGDLPLKTWPKGTKKVKSQDRGRK